ncbi:PAQR family membrane homeostasis protein TrhA [Paragemmobacter ruber]|uniref:Hemolysin III family protein n=1 Tax=Paragemmobacter ruber TaxID=1985673 RepID=A0ABW9Y126_9RHOB|nr:hemolysin III family protein [Rhodobacter ruber]NBE06211.1 hemolysin III family protein [Rhodobacter ruber]
MTLPANHPRLTKRPFTPGELLADGIVHAVALVAGMIAFSILLAHVLGAGHLGTFAALAVYAAGYFAMFGFSLAYNMVPPSPIKWVLRRFDHSAIYLMIAGTYTAVVVHFENVLFAAVLAGIVWTGAILGAVVKLVWPGRLDGLAVVAYIALGMVGIAAIGPARAALPGPSLVLLVLGGVTYVAGVAFYRWHRLKFHNAIWHLCVAVAAGLHFAAVAIAVAT